MNRKRLIITSTLSIILVSILMISTTYSIFTTTEVDEDLNVYTTGNLDVTYTLSEDNIKLENSSIMDEISSLKIKPYRITITNNGTVPYMFDLILSDTTASDVINKEYIMIKVGDLDPITLENCANNIIKEDVIVASNSSVDIDVRIWISDKIQNTEIGKSFYAKLTVDGLATYTDMTNIDNSILIATPTPRLSDYIINLYNTDEANIINIDNNLTTNTLSLNKKQSILLDNNGEYRYYGATPNNYINNNGELWRIISVSDKENSKVVKIIRDESIGKYSWDSGEETGTNNWSVSDLMTELNTLYYNKKSGECYNGKDGNIIKCDFTKIGLNNNLKNITDEVTWYTNQISLTEKEFLYPADYYNYERTINNWTGKIGLIYPSDYLYAIDYETCTNYNETNINYGSCIKNNWLHEEEGQWTISSSMASNNKAIHINSKGYIEDVNNEVYQEYLVKPVLYLKTDTIIISGTGTIEDPYLIA